MRCETPLVKIDDLTVTFSRWGQKVRALDKVSLSVPPGQWVMLVGHNGSGKSTMLKAICGRVRLESGSVTVEGDPVQQLSASQVASRMFHVHQDPLLGTAAKLTLYENLLMADDDGAHMSRKALQDKYKRLLRSLGLAERLKQLARHLSGGERQLLALLIAQLRPSSLMLLDEPLAALDPTKAEQSFQLVEALHKSGRTIIHVTHDPSMAISKGDRTVALRDGAIIYDKLEGERNAHDIKELWASEVTERDDSASGFLTVS